MDDDLIAQFTSITSATPEAAAQYLSVTDNNLEQAIQLFFESDGNLDLGGANAAATSRPSAPPATAVDDGSSEPIMIDSDGEAKSERPSQPAHAEDDEAMARRLQEEAYGASAQGDGQEGVRAPLARTAETLMGPSDWRNNPDEMSAAIAEQMMARSSRFTGGRPGIFNQRPTQASIWESENADEETRRRALNRATAGASDTNSKFSMLAEMYRPPTEIMSTLPWDALRAEGKDQEKWILVDVQDPAVFDCQVLNRDIWKNPEIKETVKENFLFKQYTKADPAAQSYINYYFHAHENQDAYPHIAIVDPRTGEQVKVWSGTTPKPIEFLTQLHEFLDRYSLKADARNPVAKRKPEPRRELDVNKLTEEEMLEIALQNSLGAGTTALRPDDPDDLTRSVELGKGKARADPMDESADGDDALSNGGTKNGSAGPPSVFSTISSARPHTEPPVDPTTTTRIQFRHAGGRQIRRFGLDEQVRRIYEWLKSEPIEGKQGVEFELIFMGKNLLGSIDQTIDEAGLKNGSVMVELLES